MGSCFSSNPSLECRNARVVQLNGHVQDFDYPVSVSEITAKLPKHFVCTQSQLLSNFSRPLMPNTFLEAGQVYFLLPLSFFQSNYALVDLAPIARKLTNIAKNSPSKVKAGNANLSGAASSDSIAPTTCLNGFPGTHMKVETGRVMQSSQEPRLWKPVLSIIRERSFNRRSESNLQE